MTGLLSDFLIGEWRISPKLNRVTNENGSVRLKNKSMEVLCVLAEANGEPVSRDEFMEAVWPRMVVTDDVLTQSIAELRRAFGDDARNPSVIETIPRVGFRLIAPVKAIDDTQPVAARAFTTPMIAGSALVAVAAVAWIFLTGNDENRSPVISVDEPPSIAVLPFVNISNDSENAIFANGLTEEIRSLLGRVSGLKVVGRTSSQIFKDSNEDVQHIGEKLGVTSVLEGSVRKSGQRIRVTAQLIDVVDGSQIWANTYDRELTEIFSVQDEVAGAILANLEVHVGQNLSRGQPTSNVNAYTLFLQAKAAAFAYDFDEAKRLAEAALVADPGFGEAQEFLAFVSWYKPRSIFRLDEAQHETLTSAAKALAIDPELPLANAIFEGTRIDGHAFYKEFAAYERAANAQPNNPVILTTYFFYLMLSGYVSEAYAVARQQMDIEPLSALSYVNQYLAHYAGGRFDEAEEAIRVVQNMRGGVVPWQMGDIYMARGEFEKAVNIYEDFLDNEGVFQYLDIRKYIFGTLNAEDGSTFLDQAISEILDAVPDDQTFLWSQSLILWYLYFDYMDRYFAIIYERQLGQAVWTGSQMMIFWGTIYRNTGFTAHHQYLDVVTKAGIVDVWERRGPPDYCEKLDTEWVCK